MVETAYMNYVILITKQCLRNKGFSLLGAENNKCSYFWSFFEKNAGKLVTTPVVRTNRFETVFKHTSKSYYK